MFTIVLTLLELIYISAGMIMNIENFERSGPNPVYPMNGELNFHTSIYFVMVTLSTVGYGEITPISEFGKVIVMFVILVTIILIPR